MQPLQSAVGKVEPELGAAAGLGRWFMEVTVLPVRKDFQRRRQHSATTAHTVLPVYGWPALGMHGTLQDQMQTVQCEVGVMEPLLRAMAGLDRWSAGGTVLPAC